MSIVSKIKGGVPLIKNLKSTKVTTSQWRKLPRVLNWQEKIVLTILIVLFLGSGVYLTNLFYLRNTEIQASDGGEYREALIGQPRFINPIYAVSSDVDRDVTELIFSGLTKYDTRGQIVLDLAARIDVQEEGKIFEVYLKENAFWHDGQPVEAQDVIFTIQTIQNADYKSPLRANWLGVETEKISAGSEGLQKEGIRFKLKNPYAGFLERLTLKILPRHIWQNITPENFSLSIYNLKPVGSGPYRIQNLAQDESGKIIAMNLARFENYFAGKPHLETIAFTFYDNENQMLQEINRGEIDGFSFNPGQDLSPDTEKLFNKYVILWPRYFALFLNSAKSKVLAQKEVRQAINYATSKDNLVQEVLSGQGMAIESPILSEIFGLASPSKVYEFNIAKAEELLRQAGFQKKDDKWEKAVQEPFTAFKSDLRMGSEGSEVQALQTCLKSDPEIYPSGKVTGYFGQETKDAVIRFQEKYAQDILAPSKLKSGNGVVGPKTREKLNEVCAKPKEILPLKLSIATTDDPLLVKTVEVLKKQWGDLGIEVGTEIVPLTQLETDFIKPRNYEALLFGQVLEFIIDPFPFWHSSQKKDPGLNLANYQNDSVDKLLAEARTTLDPQERIKKYQQFQDLLLADAPAVLLYSPFYLYFVSPEIKGIDAKIIFDPSKRFTGIENWYIYIKRVWE